MKTFLNMTVAISLLIFPMHGFAAENGSSGGTERNENSGTYFDSCGKDSGKDCSKEKKGYEKWGKKKFIYKNEIKDIQK